MMLTIGTQNKGLRFLLACLIYKILRGDFDQDFDEDFDGTPLDWELYENGPEAHYFKMLYQKAFDFHLVKSLFTQTISPFVCDVMVQETIFEQLIYGGGYWNRSSLEPSPNLYELIFIKDFYKLVRQNTTTKDIDEILGWPKDFSSIFFPYMYGQPLQKNVLSLGEALGFKDWVDGRMPESKQLSLTRKPRECPFCHSKQMLDVLVGIPAIRIDPDKHYVHGCCIMGVNPPPDWYCKHCHLPIWKEEKIA